MALYVTADENGLMGFTLEQPANSVKTLKKDAPVAKEGLLRKGDIIEGFDGVDLASVHRTERVPGEVKEVNIVRRDLLLAQLLLRIRDRSFRCPPARGPPSER